MIAQLIKRQTKVIYDNRMREIAEDDQYDQAGQQSEANYNLPKESAGYLKYKREDDMDTVRIYGFGSGLLGNFTYTVQKRYLHKFKFHTGQSPKIKDYWRCLKKIKAFLPYFPPNKSIGALPITQLSWMALTLTASRVLATYCGPPF